MTRFLLAFSVLALVIGTTSMASDGPTAHSADQCAPLWGYAQDNCYVLTGGRGW